MLAPSFAGKPADLTEENLQSRIRGTTLMALSQQVRLDGAHHRQQERDGRRLLHDLRRHASAATRVIKDVLKTRVYDLCRYVNTGHGRARSSTRACSPSRRRPSCGPTSATTRACRPTRCSTRSSQLYVEDDRTTAEIIELGHDEAIVRRITRLVDINEYKRRQCPPGVKVSTKAFGKDRRLPITNGYR